MIAAASHSLLCFMKSSGSNFGMSRSGNPRLSRLVVSLGLVRCSRPLSVVTRVWESESGSGVRLEEEIFHFMRRSSKPERFPTKEELIAAGRMDLVEGIIAEGGWLALGWGLDGEDEDDERIFQQRLDGGGWSGFSEVAASSSSLTEMERDVEDTGIEGILSRLEKERIQSFAVGPREKDDELRGLRLNAMAAGTGISDWSTPLTASEELFNDSEGAYFQNGSFMDNYCTKRSSSKLQLWRKWSSQRAGYLEGEFEAAETFPLNMGNGRPQSSPFGDMSDKIYEVAEGSYQVNGSRKNLRISNEQNFQYQINSRLQQLEQELSSVLNLLRSDSDAVASPKVLGNHLEDWESLSDAVEFQQNEIMKARDQLRSTRAKLAILEGKIALKIIDTLRAVEGKQKKIDNAQKVLCLLRTACIVWPNSASEVLLTGSFDGWISQRRMDRSSSGIFSLNIKLYPGQYEIKFIVDGSWRVDPLRPIVNANGYDNNLLIVF
ncbi:protein PTST homolog 2, chloroplastic-like [Aristolochia californica]|uniref:protein PTST homolog 2, chloroplastic-like n=1 Tax=Aristolochia californica TaxID=171875 RepID=UPI0035D79AAB